jgi:hypothetical protein
VRVLTWHVHGSWSTAFVAGPHEYVVPVTPDRGPYGLGRARTYDWPESVVERTPEQLRDEDVDVVVLQRPVELELTERWLGRRPGRDVPAVYVEHNTPRGDVDGMRHPLGARDDIPLVHVTHFNAVAWDNGRAPVQVIEHGVVDPGARYTGDVASVGVVVNEPVRRWRVTGTDLLPRFAAAAPLDVFGMAVDGLPSVLGVPPDGLRTFQDLSQGDMHAELARRRVYLHPLRWTSLGLSLLEAMHLGMPVVVLATTEAVEAVPPGAGVLSTCVDRLVDACRRLVADEAEARELGCRARAAALERYSLQRFLRNWDRLLTEVTR